jgi:cell division septation protein DedD
MADEGVHEIQLNGKQLVFMFMAVTVVAVVIFLCGVMVGRGVRAPHTLEAAEQTVETPADPTAVVQPAVVADTSTTTGSSAPLSTQEKLTYADRLASPTAPPETLREPVVQNLSAAERTSEPAPATRTPPPAAKPPAPAKVEATPAKAEATPAKVASSAAKPEPKAVSEAHDAAGNGFVVQVTAVKARSEADTIAKRLSSKGFPSYVTTPGPGAARVFRVRVGKYADRREAESVARRLEKEEQFKPWITR